MKTIAIIIAIIIIAVIPLLLLIAGGLRIRPATEEEETADLFGEAYHGAFRLQSHLAAFGPVATTNFCHLNAFKYLWRAGQKEGNSTVQDFEKAGWYINKAVELVKKQEKDEH